MRWPTLRHKWQFDLVYSKGRKCTSPALVLFYLGTAPDPGVAFVASRRVGGAVVRNRAKRLMRVAFREVASTRGESPGWFVLIARKDIVRRRSPELASELRLMVEGLDLLETREL